MKPKITLILGAGASRPYGFPTAGELREILVHKNRDRVEKILADLRAPERLWDEACGHLDTNFKQDEIKAFQDEFYYAQSESIDEFVLKRGEPFAKIARHALAAVFLLCEKAAKVDGDWYRLLRRFLIRDQPQLEAEHLQLITFNYERSFEFFFWKAIQHTFGLREGIAYDAILKVRIHHVYGTLGNLRQAKPTIPVPWGSFSPETISAAADQLGLASSRVPSLPNEVAEFLRTSDFVLFLGFGFWPENVELIRPELKREQGIFASDVGVATRTKNEVERALSEIRINWGTGLTAEGCLQSWNIPF